MFPLLRYFSLASLAALLLVAGLIIAITRNMAINQLIHRGEVTHVALTQAFGNAAWPRFAAYLTGVAGLDAEALRARGETAEIHETIRMLTHDLPVLKVKIYNLDGLTVYSSEPSQIGESKKSNPGFLSAALDGIPASKLSRRGRFSSFSGEVYDRDIIETYAPIHALSPEGEGEIEAVFEFYSDVTPLMEEIKQAERTLLVSLASVFAVLYGALFFIVRRADRILKGQYEDILVTQKELRGEKLQAEAAARARGEFLANMSHEIRTPMTAILGYAERLLDHSDKENFSPRQIEAIETIQRNGEHLLEVINEILDLSKIEAGRLEPQVEAFSPTGLAQEVATLMRDRAAEKGISLELEIEGSVPAALESDSTRIRQILINLVGNAVKFTEDGQVQIAVGFRNHTSTPTLQLLVRDTGIGMREDQIHQLFNPFSQADPTPSRKHGGTGLGLAICDRLTRLLGGTIDVESTPGEGSSFQVTLPVSIPDRFRPPQPSVPVPRSRRNRQDQETPPPRLPDGCRVLIAEDGRDNQRLISEILGDAGARVEIAENGALAIDAVRRAEERREPFDVVLMDMQMPVLDGHEAVNRLRAMGYRRPIVALTAHAMPGDRKKYLDAGCDDYATKPVDRRRLIEMVTRLSGPPHRTPIGDGDGI